MSTLTVGNVVLGDYEIKKVLHKGTMSNVYIVQDINLGTLWVLKEAIKDNSNVGKLRYDSIIREANIIKALNHDGVPRIVTMKEFEDRTLILMDYVAGFSIQKIINDSGEMSVELTLQLCLQLAAVMAYLHRKKLIYRDLKPDNVMVEHGKIKLLDFGISEVVREDNLVITENLGTRGYAAPEQHVVGKKYDFRSDIYSFGATMFHMLTGVHPYNFQSYIEETEAGKRRHTDKGKPLNIRELVPSLPESLSEFVLKCTAMNPADRYQTFEEVIYALQNYDEIDSKHIKAYRRKIMKITTLGLGGMILIGSSLVPLSLESKNLEDQFQNQLTVAEQTKKQEDWVKALNYNESSIDALEGYLNSAKTDGVFSAEEQLELLNYINPHLEEIKKKDGYNNFAYDLGNAFWFYTDTPEERHGSISWFEDAVAFKSSEANKATIMHSIGVFERDISGAVRESSDAGLYEKYWTNLMNAKQVLDGSGEILELQLNKTISDAINQYVGRLKADGVAKEAIEEEIRRLEDYVLRVDTNSERSEELLELIKQNLAGLGEKVDTVYYEPTNE